MGGDLLQEGKDGGKEERKLYIVAGLIAFTGSTSFTFIFPFVGYLVISFGDYDTATAGYVSGILLSALFIFQMVYGHRWARAGDRYSRSRVLTCEIAGVAISTLALGFSRSLLWALVARSSVGILSSDLGLANSKVILLERCGGDQDKEAKASTFIMICSTMGGVLGPLIGGSLYYPCGDSSPVKPYVQGWINDDNSLFCYYRPLLPCLTVGLMLLVAVISGFVVFPTSDSGKGSEDTLGKDPSASSSSSPYSSLQFGFKEYFGIITSPVNDLRDYIVVCGGRGRDEAATVQTTNDSSQTKDLANTEKNFRHFWDIPLVRSSIILFVGSMSAHTSFAEVFPLYAIAPKSLGGLEWAESELGVFFSVCFSAQFLTVCFFRQIVAKVGRATLVRWALYAWIPLYSLFPLLTMLGGDKTRQLYVGLVVGMLRSSALGIVLTSVTIFLSVVAPVGSQGLVQGYAQTVASFFRLTMPLTMAPLFAWSISEENAEVNASSSSSLNSTSVGSSTGRPFPFDYHLVFLLMASTIAVTAILTRGLTESALNDQASKKKVSLNPGGMKEEDERMDQQLMQEEISVERTES